MRGVRGRSPDLARACRSSRSDGYVQLRVDIPPEMKDALVQGARGNGTTLRAFTEYVIALGLRSRERGLREERA